MEAQLAASQAHVGGTTTDTIPPPADVEQRPAAEPTSPATPIARNGIHSLSRRTLLVLAILLSMFFIATILCAFAGARPDKPIFQDMLDHVAANDPGIVLVGESVDIDINEPAVTIRWSILACGSDFVLSGSEGTHGSKICGLPSTAFDIFVDNDDEVAASYDPALIPFNSGTGSRRTIQNLVQFDSDHVLDVHDAYIYPFDSYFLSTTIRAMAKDNTTIAIKKLAAIDLTSAFDIQVTDMSSFVKGQNDTQLPSRDLDVRMIRPAGARMYALLIFIVSWMLSHVSLGNTLVAKRQTDFKSILKHILLAGPILLIIPQLRNSMPDAPDMNCALIDVIGYFPQMVVSAFCFVVLLLILVVREFELKSSPAPIQLPPTPPASPSAAITTFDRRRPPSIPHDESVSARTHYELHRMKKFLRGHYVFPPVEMAYKSEHSSADQHRRCRTSARIVESNRSQDSDVVVWN